MSRLSGLQYRGFREDRMADHRALVRGVNHMDLFVARLHGRWIPEVAWSFSDVPSVRKRLCVVGRDRHRQRRAVREAVVEHEEQMAVSQFDEVHRGIRVRKLRIAAFAPGASAVARLSSHQPSVRTASVVAPAPAEGEELIRGDLGRGRLNVPQSRADALPWLPKFGRGIESEKKRSAVGIHFLCIASDFVVNRQQKITVVQNYRMPAHHHPLFTGDHERVGPGPGAVAGDLAGNPRIGPVGPVA